MKKLLAVAVIIMMCVPTVLAETNVLQQGSTVGLKVNDDRGGTIQNAFTVALSMAGLKNDNTHPDYNLDVTITIIPLALSNTQNTIVYIQFYLIANLLDNNGRVLLPYTISWREGHVDQTRAEIRAFRVAVTKINAEYRELLNGIILGNEE
jgi:hypothetical protein